VIKICANPDTYNRLSSDMDVNAGKIIEGKASLEDVGNEIYECVVHTCQGFQTASEQLGHHEFLLTYKSFVGLEPGAELCRSI